MQLVKRKFQDKEYELPFGWGDKSVETYHYTHDLTNRQLLKNYRHDLKELEYIQGKEREGSHYHLGERIMRVICRYRRDVQVLRWEVERRFSLGLISKNK